MAILTCKQSLECISLQIFSKKSNSKITGSRDFPTLKAYPTRGVGGRFDFFFAKMKGKDEVEGTRSNFTPWLCDFEHQGENCLGSCCNPRLRRTRVNAIRS